MLYASYNGVSHLDRPVEVYKENRKRHAPIGWVYLDDEEADVEKEEEYDENDEDEQVEDKPKHARQSRNGVPIPNFQRGEIVWARVDRYPSHPAKVKTKKQNKKRSTHKLTHIYLVFKLF
jgi:hypothetical protein